MSEAPPAGAGQRLLIVDPEPADLAAAVELFSRAGYAVAETYNAEEAAALEAAAPCELALLAWRLPPSSGREFAAQLQARADRPVLFIAGRPERPPATLLTDGRQVLRPPGPAALWQVAEALRLAAAGQPSARAALRAGPLTLDLRGRDAFVHGQPLGLRPKEFALLRVLADNLGQIVAPARLAALVWGRPLAPGSQTLTVHIHRLRAKLDHAAHLGAHLRAKHGAGYLLSPDLRRES